MSGLEVQKGHSVNITSVAYAMESEFPEQKNCPISEKMFS